MILTLWATETRKEKSKENNINVIFKRIGFVLVTSGHRITPVTTRVAHRTMIEEKWSSWDVNSQLPASQGNPQPRT
jgi:hypothetical protein